MPREAGTWRAPMAEIRSALRIPEAPGMPSWPASDLSSGSSIEDRPPDLRGVVVLSFWVVSVTE